MDANAQSAFKIPLSVLVVIHTPDLQVLLIERADYISFTGSTRVGREVAAECGRRLIGCSLELGGKNALIVRGDADIDRSVEIAERAAFGNAGGGEFTTSIYPFILRGVTLAGVNANHPVGQRGSAWARLADDLRPAALERIAYRIGFDELQGHCEALIAGRARGRAVVVFD